MQILIDSTTTPTQLRLIATLLTSLAGDAAAHIELTPVESPVPAAKGQLELFDAMAELTGMQGFDGEGMPAHVVPFAVPKPQNVVPFIPTVTARVDLNDPFASAPSVPAIPSTSAQTAPTPDAAIVPVTHVPTFDKTGRVWDARIDSSSKAMNADGTWRARRGVDAATYQAVLRELGVTVPPPVVVAPPAPILPVVSIPVPPIQTAVPMLPPTTGVQTSLTGVSQPPVPPVTPTNAPPVTFSGLMQLAMPLTREGKLTSDWLNACSVEIGAPSPQHMIGNQDLLIAARNWIQARA